VSRRSKKGHADGGHENAERWLLTYADLITLLMVFFVVMYSMSRADVGKFARLQAAIQRAFHVEVLKGNVPTSLHGEDGAMAPTSILQEAMGQTGPPNLDSRLVTTIDELRQAMIRLPVAASPGSTVEVGMARDGVVISLSGNVVFDSGRADLKPEGRAMLDLLAERLKPLPNEIRVEGHTDDIPIQTALYPSNWELSSARATTVARYFVEHGGIAPYRLIAAGYGQFRPVVSNEERAGRARNRRVDIVVITGSPGLPVAASGVNASRGVSP